MKIRNRLLYNPRNPHFIFLFKNKIMQSSCFVKGHESQYFDPEQTWQMNVLFVTIIHKLVCTILLSHATC